MKKSKLEQPHLKARIIEGLASGETRAALAREVGLSRSAVSRFARKEEVQSLVEGLREELITKCLMKTFQNIQFAIDSYQSTTDPQLKQHGFKASLEVMRGAGLLPGQGGNIYVHQDVFERPALPEGVRRVLEEIAAKEAHGPSLLDEEDDE